MSRGRKPKSKDHILNWEQFFNKNVGAYLQNIIIDLGDASTKGNESGLELLKKIKIEKVKLIKDKKLREEKDLPYINEKKVPFKIPANWVWCRLGDICVKIGSGSTPKGSNYSQDGIPFFRSQNIYNTSLIYDDIKFITQEVQKQMSGTIVTANDILLNITGGSIGRCALVPKDFNAGNVSQHVCIIRPICIHNEFLHKVLLTPFFQESIFNSVTGAGREGLPKYNLEQLLIPLPPLNEQVKIVDFINDFENNQLKNDDCYFNSKVERNIIELHESQLKYSVISHELTHQLSLVNKLRQQLLQDAVQGKLVEQNKNDEPACELFKKIKAEKEQLITSKILKVGKEIATIKSEEIPFQIPQNWVWCKLGEIAYITSGSTPSQSAFVETGIPYLKMYNLRNQKIDFLHKPQYIKEQIHNGQLKRCRAFPGDILMNIVGPPLGKIALIPDDLPECNFNQAAVLIRPYLKVMNLFLFWYLNEMSEINSIDTKGVAGQDNISVTQAQNMRIPVPPIEEQHRIVIKLDELMLNCNELEASIKQSAVQNEKLLQQVLREALRKEN